jgi:hypothetical protein
MQKGMAIAACAALLSMAAVTEADAGGRAWSRGGSFTGPRGTTTWERSGECGGDTCTRSRTLTGPYGGTVTRGGSVNRDGSWDRDARATGPYGRTWEKESGGACANGTCSFGGTVTGPRGGTGTHYGAFDY